MVTKARKSVFLERFGTIAPKDVGAARVINAHWVTGSLIPTLYFREIKGIEHELSEKEELEIGKLYDSWEVNI